MPTPPLPPPPPSVPLTWAPVTPPAFEPRSIAATPGHSSTFERWSSYLSASNVIFALGSLTAAGAGFYFWRRYRRSRSPNARARPARLIAADRSSAVREVVCDDTVSKEERREEEDESAKTLLPLVPVPSFTQSHSPSLRRSPHSPRTPNGAHVTEEERKSHTPRAHQRLTFPSDRYPSNSSNDTSNSVSRTSRPTMPLPWMSPMSSSMSPLLSPLAYPSVSLSPIPLHSYTPSTTSSTPLSVPLSPAVLQPVHFPSSVALVQLPPAATTPVSESSPLHYVSAVATPNVQYPTHILTFINDPRPNPSPAQSQSLHRFHQHQQQQPQDHRIDVLVSRTSLIIEMIGIVLLLCTSFIASTDSRWLLLAVTVLVIMLIANNNTVMSLLSWSRSLPSLSSPWSPPSLSQATPLPALPPSKSLDDNEKKQPPSRTLRTSAYSDNDVSETPRRRAKPVDFLNQRRRKVTEEKQSANELTVPIPQLRLASLSLSSSPLPIPQSSPSPSSARSTASDTSLTDSTESLHSRTIIGLECSSEPLSFFPMFPVIDCVGASVSTLTVTFKYKYDWWTVAQCYWSLTCRQLLVSLLTGDSDSELQSVYEAYISPDMPDMKYELQHFHTSDSDVTHFIRSIQIGIKVPSVIRRLLGPSSKKLMVEERGIIDQRRKELHCMSFNSERFQHYLVLQEQRRLVSVTSGTSNNSTGGGASSSSSGSGSEWCELQCKIRTVVLPSCGLVKETLAKFISAVWRAKQQQMGQIVAKQLASGSAGGAAATGSRRPSIVVV